MKDFRAEEYVAHTKCVTEAERYAAKGQYTAKPDKNKGAQKQEIWTECIEELASRADLDGTVRDVLQRIAAQSNVPRKKPKFINFLKSSMRFNVQRAEKVWEIIEEGLEEFKKRAAPPPRPNASKSADETKANGTVPSASAGDTTESSNGVETVHVNGAANGTTNGSTSVDDASSAKQIADVFSHALQQPDLDKATRKILKKLQKCSDVPLNIENPKRKKFTAFIRSECELDAVTAEQIWTIVSDAASVIEEAGKAHVTNGVATATTNGNAKKRKTAVSDKDVDATNKKPKLHEAEATEAIETINGDDNATNFDWEKNILRIFNKNSADNVLELAALQTKVMKRYAKHIGAEGDDGATAQHVKKVKKQLKKIDSLIIENGVVKLKA